jgi:hypothetical protein
MALTAAQVESASPNAWTGKSTSLAYETEAEVAAYLTARGLTDYDGRTADQKAQDLISVTDAVEAEMAERFRGAVVQLDQGLLFPARGAYTSRGELVDADTAPPGYLAGIALLCEEKAAGTFLPTETGAAIKVEEEGGARTEYFEGGSLSSIEAQHPAAWRRIAEAIPKVDL